MSIIATILSLPVFVKVPVGPEFQLKISHNGTNITLAYEFITTPKSGYWDNPYLREEKQYTCTFLYLSECIETDADLLRAIEDTKAFLNKNGLMP